MNLNEAELRNTANEVKQKMVDLGVDGEDVKGVLGQIFDWEKSVID